MKLDHLLYKKPSGRILLLVLALIFTICVGSADSASEPGTITIVSDEEPRTLDPNDISTGDVGRVLMKNILEPLVDVDPDDNRITPRLAHSWKQINANTWHFFLRKNVRFHDGEDFNAAAVIFSIKRLYDQRLVSKIRGKYFADFKMEGKALDSHTLEIKTDKTQPLMVILMGMLPICSPNTPSDKLIRNPIGTGPFKFVKWDAGTQMILERFDGYWGKQPQVRKATYIWRGESSVRAAMVFLGEADLAPRISREDANRPDMDHSYLDAETTFLRFGGVWEPPLNDRRFRLALNYAVDRNAIRGSILSKDIIPANQIVVPNVFGHNPDLRVWPYDPQKAKQLLDEARKDGVPVDKEITLFGRIGMFPRNQELLEAIITYYKAVGPNVKLKMIEQGAAKPFQDKPFAKDVGPYIMQRMHDNNKGDAAFTAYFQYHCNGLQSAMCDKKVDDLIEKAQGATGEERKNLWQAVFKRIHEEVIPNVFLFHMVGYSRVGKRINFKPSIAITSEIELGKITFNQ